MLDYDESRLLQQVDEALTSVRKVLETNRNPTVPSEVPHLYADKYGLADLLTNTSLAATINCFELLGVEGATLKTMKAWADAGRSVTIRLESTETCKFNRETTREVESATKHVTDWESSGIGGAVSSLLRRVDKSVTRVTEYFWDFTATYELFVYAGADPAGDRAVLQRRVARAELMTTANSPPEPAVSVQPVREANITWLLKNIGARGLSFAIDRASPRTFTPRRNDAISAALSYFTEIFEWATAVRSYFSDHLFPIQQKNNLNMAAINTNDIFIPVVPLFEVLTAASSISKSLHADAVPLALVAPPSSAVSSSSAGLASSAASSGSVSPRQPPPSASPLMPLPDINRFLSEQRRSLGASNATMAKTFPAPDAAQLISAREANLVIVLMHLASLSQRWADGVDYVEDMMRQQLVAAIGRSLTPNDFSEYMRFHYRKIFQTTYQPKPFAYAIRRPPIANSDGDSNNNDGAAGVMTGAGLVSRGSGCTVYSPEGVLTFVSSPSSGAVSSPVFSCVSKRSAPSSSSSSSPLASSGKPAKMMSFPINAATRISFRGDTYVHAVVNHQFSGDSGTSFSLSARSRQFSSFAIVIGTIVAADALQPKYAFVAQNRDEYVLPLSLAALPSPQEFQDAIESLSPEQQRFAKAFRAMQLEATLFAIVAIQIKPQLEELLRIPAGGLIKELKLTEEVLELLLKYNIPSDMLSFDPSLASSSPLEATPSLLPPTPPSLSGPPPKPRTIISPRSTPLPLRPSPPAASPALQSHIPAVREVAKYVDEMNRVIQAEKDKEIEQAKKEAEMRRRLERERAKEEEVKYRRAERREVEYEKSERRMKSSSKKKESRSMAFDDIGGGGAPGSAAAAPIEIPEAAPVADAPSDVGADGGGDSGGDASQPEGVDNSLGGEADDISAIPSRIEDRMAALEKAEKNSSNHNSNLSASTLRPTIITVDEVWQKTSYRTLMSPAATTTMAKKEIEDERNRTFDLLDALTRGGSLPLVAADLHVVIATTHCFDKTLVETIIQDNVNPIEQVERSVLMLASTVHNVPASELLRLDHLARIKQQAPVLFTADELQPPKAGSAAGAGVPAISAPEEEPTSITVLTHSTMFM